jgi:hypothetical protein
MTESQIGPAIAKKHPEHGNDVTSAIVEAKRRITVAADYNRDQQIGLAINRCNDLYSRSYKEQDYKTALAAQREYNRLLALYALPVDDDPTANNQETEKQIVEARAHLDPLELAPRDYPLSELCRVVASKFRDYRAAADRAKKTTPVEPVKELTTTPPPGQTKTDRPANKKPRKKPVKS